MIIKSSNDFRDEVRQLIIFLGSIHTQNVLLALLDLFNFMKIIIKTVEIDKYDRLIYPYGML